MGSVGNTPYVNYKDCSKGICSIYCPQWCYIIFPPPPPSGLSLNHDSRLTDLSPLVIAFIGIFACAFLLVSYYTIISKYCRMTRRRDDNFHSPGQAEDQMIHDDQPPASTSNGGGLDQALINTITFCCRYRKGDDVDGLVQGTDCSVCLNEFQQDQTLRLLPNCSHAFHLPCIDTWLKYHSTCPLCRSNIAPLLTPHQIRRRDPMPEASPTAAASSNISSALAANRQHRSDTEESEDGNRDKEESEDRDNRNNEIRQAQFRRSVSLESSVRREGHVSVAVDILPTREAGDIMSNYRSRVMRSVSTGRSRDGNGRDCITSNST